MHSLKKKKKKKKKLQRFLSQSYNLGQIVCRIFQVLSEFLVTTSEMEVDYYHQKKNVRIAL